MDAKFMTNILLYLKRKKALVAAIKALGEKLREERKLRQQWQKLAMNGSQTLGEIETAVTEARQKHRDRAEWYLYGD